MILAGQASRAYHDQSLCPRGLRTNSLYDPPLKEPPLREGAQVVYPGNFPIQIVLHFLPFRRYKDKHKALLETSQVPKQASHPPASKVKVEMQTNYHRKYINIFI